ncbi:MAG: serine hydrolase, partial [Emcibacteraceae bacterium]|nr:serine hydrolase [Emcibacteraceae bacterium]
NFDLKSKLNALVNNPETSPTEISGLQMILIKDGEVSFEHAVGIAHRDIDNNVKLTNDHKVRIASISKFILTMAFMSLVDEGKVSLDDDVSDYLGFKLRNPNFPNRIITTRQVLSHTSSIRDGAYYFMGLDGKFKDFFIAEGNDTKSAAHYDNGNHFAHFQNQGPGDYFTYSNLNFGILSGIAENLSGQRMDIFVKESLFDKLGLTSSFNTCTLYENNYASLATLYRRGDGGTTWNSDGPWLEQVDGDPIGCYYESDRFSRNQIPDLTPLDHYTIGKNPTLFSPQGGLRASSRDLAIIMQLLMNGGIHKGEQIMAKSSIDEMMKTVWQYDPTLSNGHTGGESELGDSASDGMMTAYGLSTHIVDLKNWNLSDKSHIFYGHLGSAYGLQGQFWFDPLTNDGIITFITGVGDDPSKAKATIPLYAIEESLLRLSLKGLDSL